VNDRLKIALVLAVAAISAPRSAWAVGETNGRVGGTITEAQTGAPVPGATVTISGANLIGGPRTVTTGDDGRYEIVEIPPGSYSVEVSYSGVKPIKRRVVVRQGEMLPLDIAWSAELAETEVTVVVEERHMTKPDSTQTGTVISNDTSAKIATGRSYQGISEQVAGVADVNGGGNPQIKGGNLMNNRYLVDGLDITDPVTNTFSANINFDSISSVEVITGGMEAQYNTLGGVINLITNAGSDEWHVDTSLYVNHQSFSASGQFGPNLYDYENPRNRLHPPPTQSYNANLNVGGPLLKHRLWFNVSVEYGYAERSTPSGPPLNLQTPSRHSHRILTRLKLTWAPNSKHRLTLSASADPAYFFNDAQDNFRLPEAETYQAQGGVFVIFQWDWFINNNANFNLQTGFQFNHIDFGSQGQFTGIDHDMNAESMFSDANKSYDLHRPQHVNASDGTTWYQGATAAQFDRRYTVQFDPSISLRGRGAGYHDAKIGIQARFMKWDLDVRNTGDGVSYTDNGGGMLEGGLCLDETSGKGCFLKTVTSDYSQGALGGGVGLYLQDRWKPWKRLTILPGIRFDYGSVRDSIGRTAYNLFGVGPRIGFNIDLTGDQKTIFSAFYGRANDTMNMLPATYGSPSALSNTYLYSTTLHAFDTSSPVATSGGSKGTYYDPNITTPPHSDEVTVGIRRELFLNSVGSIEYTYKHIANMWDWIEMNRIWDPSGYRQIGYVDNANPQSIYKITTNNGNVREYQGIDFVAEARPSDHWDIYLGYTLSWLYGTGAEQFSGQVNGTLGPYYNPRQTIFYDGFLPEDVRHQLKLRVAYDTHGFNVGGFLEYTSGTIAGTKSFFNYIDGGTENYRSPQGTEPFKKNDPRGWSELRTPDLFILNVRVSYDFHELIKQHLILIADMFNLFNLRTPTSVVTANLPTYGSVGGRVTPFRFQLGLRYIY